MAKKNLEANIETTMNNSITFNPLLNALRENDKKNLFKSNAISYFHKTGFPLIDYYFGSVVNVHNDLGEIIRQEPMIGQSAGTFNVVLANSGAGKAQPISTKIPTPDGYKLMGDLKVGDKVFDRYGRITTVIGVFDQGIKKICNVHFQDGRVAKCCDEHLWAVKLKNECRYNVRPLNYIMKDMIKYPLLQYQIPMLTHYVDYNPHLTPVDPYTFGIMLADGLFNDKFLCIDKDEKFIADKLCDLNGYYNDNYLDPDMLTIYKNQELSKMVLVSDILKDIPEMIGLKPSELYIPDVYLHNNVIGRIELLRGLMDGSGYISSKNKNYRVKFFAFSKKLMDGVRDLLWGLGYSSSKIFDSGKKILHITLNVPNNKKQLLFTEPSKVKRASYASYVKNKNYSTLNITNIEYSHEEEARCIKVGAPDQLYLTEDYIITHNTTLVVQIAANIARQYKNGIVIHYDCESRFDISRGENITKLPIECFNEDTGLYKLKQGLVTLDEMQEAIVDLYVKKMKMRDEVTLKTGRMNEFNKEIEVFEPTVIIIDSIASVVESSFSFNDTKEVNKVSELRSNTAGARDAKTLRGFLKDITPLCKEANIIIYAINHINVNMSMNAFTGPTKHQNYIKQDEAIPAGKAQTFFSQNMIKMVAKVSDDFTEEKDGFNGHMVTFEPIKSSSNQSGNASKGISFDMVLSFKDGFDSLRSLILYGRERGIIEGNKPKLSFRDDKSFTFSFKNIHTEKNEKPIYECIKKYIIPELETHLSFVEPSKFDERQLDY